MRGNMAAALPSAQYTSGTARVHPRHPRTQTPVSIARHAPLTYSEASNGGEAHVRGSCVCACVILVSSISRVSEASRE
jgi:hypothetical protein